MNKKNDLLKVSPKVVESEIIFNGDKFTLSTTDFLGEVKERDFNAERGFLKHSVSGFICHYFFTEGYISYCILGTKAIPNEGIFRYTIDFGCTKNFDAGFRDFLIESVEISSKEYFDTKKENFDSISEITSIF